MSFADGMQELVCRPAGMTTARIKNYEPRYLPNEASSYALARTPEIPSQTGDLTIAGITVATSGDGGGVGSMNDYMRRAFLSCRYPQMTSADCGSYELTNTVGRAKNLTIMRNWMQAYITQMEHPGSRLTLWFRNHRRPARTRIFRLTGTL
jgi:hypothetical protein